MLAFGHGAITLGAAVLLNGALSRGHLPIARVGGTREGLQGFPGDASGEGFPSGGSIAWLTSLAERIDIRLLLIGSLLPDIIDKPIGFFFRDTFGTDRIFCHTLLFLIAITLGGLYLYWSRGKTWLLVLSFGTFTHLILDQMWLTPQTVLWPLHGLSFDKTNLYTYLFYSLTVYIAEFVGAAMIAWFVWLLVRRRKLYGFITRGEV